MVIALKLGCTAGWHSDLSRIWVSALMDRSMPVQPTFQRRILRYVIGFSGVVISGIRSSACISADLQQFRTPKSARHRYFVSPLLSKPHSCTLLQMPQVDDSSENDIWIPHGVSTLMDKEYPTHIAHSISCFIQMCRLAEILNVILLRLYDPLRQSTEAEIVQCVNTQGDALRLWWKELPTFLKLEITDLPTYCPPSHIVTLKYAHYFHSTFNYKLLNIPSVVYTAPLRFFSDDTFSPLGTILRLSPLFKILTT
jgi:hypothetical protein